jgi:hypothetical protein
MDYTRADFSSRVGVRAVASGIVVAIAFMVFFMSPAGHLDLSGRGYYDRPPGTGFWISAGLAWATSVFIGSALASRVSRSQSPTDGLIHGLVVWAGAYLGFGGFTILAVALENPFGAGRSPLVLGGFISDALGLVAALFGGFVGARWENLARTRAARGRRLERETEVKAPSERASERRPEEASPAPT